MITKEELQLAFDQRNEYWQKYYDSSQILQLMQYVTSLVAANEERNFFSRKMNAQELIDNHILDSCLGIPYFPKELKALADFGSGGGMPAAILAIALPETIVHMYEKSPVKQEFLKSLSKFIPNITVHASVEEPLDENISLITGRGFKPINVFLQLTPKFMQNGGSYLLYKARKESIEKEIQESKPKLKNMKISLIELKNPILSVERHLVKIN